MLLGRYPISPKGMFVDQDADKMYRHALVIYCKVILMNSLISITIRDMRARRAHYPFLQMQMIESPKRFSL